MPKEWLKLLKGTLADDHENDDTTEFLLSEPIGMDENNFSGMSARYFGQVLASVPKNKVFKLFINTLGGEIDEGMAMYNMMLARGNVHTVVIGYAASMGALLAQAGAKRSMMPGTMMVIHNPQGGIDGEADQLEATAGVLRKLKSNIVDILHDRTGASKKAISDMMDATTCMSPKEALELGFCDEIIQGEPAWNSLDQKKFFNFSRSLKNARMSVAGDEGGITAQETNKKNGMKLITAALAKLGLVASADLADETAIVKDLETRFAPINSLAQEHPTLKTQLAAFESARKLRVENRVNLAITNKLIKAERKDSLISMGMTNEASLDFLDDLQAPAAGPRRGSPPVDLSQGQNSKEEQLKSLRDELSIETDPKQRGILANKIREITGHRNMFAAPAPVQPAVILKAS